MAGSRRGFPILRLWHRKNTFESLFLDTLMPSLLWLLMWDRRDYGALFCLLHLTADPSSTAGWQWEYHLCHTISVFDSSSETAGNQTSYDLYCNLDKCLLIASLRSLNVFPFHRSFQNSQKMVTTMQQEQQVRKAAALLLSEFRSWCYKLSCKWSRRNDFLPHIRNLLVLYLGTQLWVGCPHRKEKALSSLPTY